jgi:molybdopterin molybdotransferase
LKKFITYKESLQILDNINMNKIATQKLFLSDSLGRVLAKDITADENSPAYPTSAMDGYAINFEDQKLKKLKIVCDNPAGAIINVNTKKGECIKTFTGSLMPDGFDTLIPIENVTVEGDFISIDKEVPFGFAVRKVGENYKKDELLIQKQEVISYAQIGIAASLNKVFLDVFQKPIVSIASTGSEIIDLGETQTNNSQIRSSNHLTIEALAKQAGASTIQYGVVKDDKQSITNTIQNMLKHSDIVVTTGGVSVGDYDFVKDVVIDTLKAEVLFQGVLIKPGQHILFAKVDNKFIVSLPGFAYSSTVTCILYVIPLVQKLSGSCKKQKIVKAKIDQKLPKFGNKTIFTACNLYQSNSEFRVNFDGKKSGTSAILTNMLHDAALLIQDQNSKDLEVDDIVDVLIVGC